MKKILYLLFAFSLFQAQSQTWQPDLGNGKYKNPLFWSDYSDPDICRVGDDFYMTISTFNAVPALPILHSKDLVNWKIINYAIKRFPNAYFDIPQHGKGVWAPAIRFHQGWFYIYWGDPDLGVFMVRTQDPKGDWEAPVLVKKAHGNIDACPLWDDDGKVYMIHAFAHSRAGVSHVLQLQELSADGSIADAKNRDIIIHGLPDNVTLEGPKFYKRNGYYYIFAPAGGVPTGWQMVYRSKNIWGPYEERKVLETGATNINGPHQGGWVELENGEGWFIHFQEVQPYGRIPHLQPVSWINDWPVMGIDTNKDGIGNPVLEYKKPKIKAGKIEPSVPQNTDEFNNSKYNLAWSWTANYEDHWYSLDDNPGNLRLYANYNPTEGSIWMCPNIITQKIIGPTMTVTTKINVSGLKEKEKTGLVMYGRDYAALNITKSNNGIDLRFVVCENADKGYTEINKDKANITTHEVYLKMAMNAKGLCQFSYSEDGADFTDIGEPFPAREGVWVGARVGLYAVSSREEGIKGSVDFDWFRVTQ